MTLRRLMLAASCRDGARGPMARRAAAEGDFVRALDQTDRLLRITPPDPPGPGAWLTAERTVRALADIEPDPAPAPSARAPLAAGLLSAAAAAAILIGVTTWRSAPPTAPAPAEVASAPDLRRMGWTLVGQFDQPLRTEAAALLADARDFGRMIAPGLPLGGPTHLAR
ncbi:MAG: hypothetical protein ACF8R7_07435 [Phycisphaerales bacterium JB039]